MFRFIKEFLFTCLVCLIFTHANFSFCDEDKYFNDIVDYGEKYLSPDAILKYKNFFVIQCRTSDEILFLDEKYKILDKVTTPPHPSGMCIGDKFLYVTTASNDGKILKIDLETKKVISQIDASHFPRSPILSEDKNTLYILNQFENKISSYDSSSLKLKNEAKTTREPYSACIYKESIFVLNQMPESKGGLFEENISATIDIYEGSNLEKVGQIILPNGSINCKEIVSRGDYIYCTHTVGRFNVPTTQVERGWVGTDAISIIDATTKKLYATILVDDMDMGAANPYGIAISPDGKTLISSIAGTHELIVMDVEKILKKLKHEIEEDKKNLDDILNDLSFTNDIKERIKLIGFGPRGLLFKDNEEILVAMYFSDILNLVDLKTGKAERISLEGNERLNNIRRGDMLFHSADLCFQKWLSCIVCHTETRPDGINWDLMNDGIGNPKQSKSMLFAHFTPPSMITGVRENAYAAVRKGIQHIQFAKCSEEDARCIDEFLMSLQEVKSPYKFDERASLGKILFESAGCSICHEGEFLTDMKMHDVGTGLNEYTGEKFDTPTLKEIWRTAPYLYDGRASTIKDVLKKYNNDDKHGKTSNLTDSQIDDLEAYILTL